VNEYWLKSCSFKLGEIALIQASLLKELDEIGLFAWPVLSYWELITGTAFWYQKTARSAAL
jgi:hypothetical protein